MSNRALKRRHIEGIEMALVDQGDGIPLVLVHGFPLDHSMWNAQIDPLSQSSRVIVPDLRGFGQSSASDEKVTMERFADDLAALLDDLGVTEPIVFCGLSMGGYVAFQFQRKYASRLRGLILADTRALCDTPEMAAGRLQMADRIIQEGPGPLIDMMMPNLFAEATVNERPEVVESLRRVMMENDRLAIAAAARGMAERPDVTPMLSTIDCPTLVIVGELDTISPVEEMRQIAESIPDARLIEIAASGHMSPTEKPAEFNAAVVRFLASL